MLVSGEKLIVQQFRNFAFMNCDSSHWFLWIISESFERNEMVNLLSKLRSVRKEIGVENFDKFSISLTFESRSQ